MICTKIVHRIESKRRVKMYRINVLYKFQLKNGIWYTGTVLEEDSISIRIQTIRNETIVLNKEEILQALQKEGDS